MRWGTQKWLWLATLLIVVAAGFWLWRGRWGKRPREPREVERVAQTSHENPLAVPRVATPVTMSPLAARAALPPPALPSSAARAASGERNSRFAHRLSNTRESV